MSNNNIRFTGSILNALKHFFITLLFLTIPGISLADGTETLGVPNIQIATGTDVIVAGVGLASQPGDININVPAGAVVKQVLLYWEGQDAAPKDTGDNTVTVNGFAATGALIGGPVFWLDNGVSTTFRADITSLGLIGAGSNSLSIDNLDDFTFFANGAGVLVIVDDGSPASHIGILDGNDLAFINWPGAKGVTVPQTFTFAASDEQRAANLSIFVSAVAGTNSSGGTMRPTAIDVTVGGVTETFNNLLDSIDGQEWDTIALPVIIPAGETSVTVQLFSEDRVLAGGLPASLTWNAAALSIDAPPTPSASLGDRVWEDLDADGNQDCADTSDNGIIGDAGDTGAECSTGIPLVTVQLFNQCDTGTPNFLAETFTDSDGFYLFDNLDAGDYCVKVDKQSAANLCDVDIGGSVAFSPQDVGSDNASDSDVDTNGSTSIINLSAGDKNLTVDAGLHCPAKLGDRVWNDLNRDGIQDTGEPGINGVKAELFVCNEAGDPINSPIATRMTDTMNGEDGIYMFNPLMPGSYAVQFSNLPAGFIFSPANQGVDDASDSDADTATGLTMCMPLESNQIDPTKDAGLNQPPAGLGDRLWEDKDADGLQEAGEPGIPDATVNLLTPGADGQCDTGDEVFEGMTTTVGDGLYEFLNLDPGRYCVEFDISTVNICTLGDASFTARNSGDDAKDSDANTATGQTGNIDLAADQYDPTNDAGIVCPAKLGDRVWKDDDMNGIQDTGEAGVNGVDAELFACDANDMPINGAIDTTTTSNMNGEDGIYMFFDLAPGNYAVRFMEPANLVFTAPNEPIVGNDDATDSDANPASGFTDCMPLESNENNPTKDAGLIDPPDCGIGLVKTCEIITPPAPQLLECSQKVQSFTLIWNGSGAINISGVANDAPGGDVQPGDVVTFPGPYAQNNNFLTISGAVNGTSVFHTSCSDPAMDGETDNASFPNDCGRAEGNGKDNGGSFINDWTLEGLSDGSGQAVNCTADPQPMTSSCEFSATTASCDSLPDKPTDFSFHYTGGGCAASDNSQGSKTSCSGSINSSLPVDVTTSAGQSFTVDPDESFTITRDGSNTVISLSNAGGTETIDFHTSCSAPIETGDVYGSISLTALDGVGSGKDVLYSYLIQNMGSGVITNISVTDDKLGLVGSGLSLNPGGSDTLTAMGFISETTTNTATANGVSFPGAQCMVSASATVTVLPPPPCSVSVSFKELKDDKIKYEVRNTGNRVATLDELMLDFPAAYGEIKEVKLDGAIYKAKDSSLIVGPGDTIGSGDWTESKVGKRELDPGEKRTLEIKFTEKSKDYGPGDFNGTVSFEEGCMVPL